MRIKQLAVGAALTTAGIWGYAHGIEHRSATSLIVEQLLIARKAFSFFSTKNATRFQQHLIEAAEINERALPNPSMWVRQAVQETWVDGMQVFSWNDKHDPTQPVILYLHGGGYVHQPSVMHYISIGRLARLAEARVVFPIYPKLPRHTYSEAYKNLDALYAQLITTVDSCERVTLMGDSAGGGLALGFAMYLRDHGMPQPHRLVLFSPWTDIATNCPEIAYYQAVDPMLEAKPLHELGILWAEANGQPHEDEASLQHPYVSPLYGDVEGLGRITLVVGTHEILFPDSARLHHKLLEHGIDHDFIVGEQMNHVYPVFPIPEAWELQATLAQRIAQVAKH